MKKICLFLLILVQTISMGVFAETKNIRELPELEFLPVETQSVSEPVAVGKSVSKYDARDEGRIFDSGVGQGEDGVCWAFSSAFCAETALIDKLFIDQLGNNGWTKEQKEKIDLSEQHIRYSTSSTGGNIEGANRYPNGGGDFRLFEAYATIWNGLVLEKDDKYVYGDDVRDYSITASKPVKYHVQDTIHIPDAAEHVQLITPEQRAAHIEELKVYIKKYGCVYSSMCWETQYYNRSTKSYYNNGSYSLNHAVCLIGWDDNYSKNNFNSKPENDGAFIVKNPQGTTGDYMYMSYEDLCAGWNAAAVAGIDDKYNYGKIYNHDGGFANVSYTGMKYVDSVATSVFTSEYDNEVIKAVGIYTMSRDVKYKIYASTTPNAWEDYENDKFSSEPLAEGTCSLPGFSTILLDKPFSIGKAGTKYSVRVVYSCDEEYKVPVEISIPQEGNMSDEAGSVVQFGREFAAELGRSYFYQENKEPGNEWFTAIADVAVPIPDNGFPGGYLMTRVFTDAEYEISIPLAGDDAYNDVEYSVNGENKGRIKSSIKVGLNDDVVIHTGSSGIIDAVVIDGTEYDEDDVAFTVTGNVEIGFKVPGVTVNDAVIDQTKKEVTVDFTAEFKGEKTIIAALYSGSKLVGVRITNEAEPSLTVGYTEKPNKVKVMVWDSLNSLKTAIPTKYFTAIR